MVTNAPSQLLFYTLLVSLIGLFLNTSTLVYAATPQNSFKSIPAPTSPSFRECQRQFSYDGKTLFCDSQFSKDGEGLREIFKSTPQSLNELDLYQQSRRQFRFSAITGSLGLFSILLHSFVPTLLTKDPDQREQIGRWMLIGGAGVLVGGTLISLTSLSLSEKHFNRAIELHNSAHPEKPIILQIKKEF